MADVNGTEGKDFIHFGSEQPPVGYNDILYVATPRPDTIHGNGGDDIIYGTAAEVFGDDGDDLSGCCALCLPDRLRNPFGVFGSDEAHRSQPFCCFAIVATSFPMRRRHRSSRRRRTSRPLLLRRPTILRPNCRSLRER